MGNSQNSFLPASTHESDILWDQNDEVDDDDDDYKNKDFVTKEKCLWSLWMGESIFLVKV